MGSGNRGLGPAGCVNGTCHLGCTCRPQAQVVDKNLSETHDHSGGGEMVEGGGGGTCLSEVIPRCTRHTLDLSLSLIDPDEVDGTFLPNNNIHYANELKFNVFLFMLG